MTRPGSAGLGQENGYWAKESRDWAKERRTGPGKEGLGQGRIWSWGAEGTSRLGQAEQEDWSKGTRGIGPGGAGWLGQGSRKTTPGEQRLGQSEQDFWVMDRRWTGPGEVGGLGQEQGDWVWVTKTGSAGLGEEQEYSGPIRADELGHEAWWSMDWARWNRDWAGGEHTVKKTIGTAIICRDYPFLMIENPISGMG